MESEEHNHLEDQNTVPGQSKLPHEDHMLDSEKYAFLRSEPIESPEQNRGYISPYQKSFDPLTEGITLDLGSLSHSSSVHASPTGTDKLLNSSMSDSKDRSSSVESIDRSKDNTAPAKEIKTSSCKSRSHSGSRDRRRLKGSTTKSRSRSGSKGRQRPKVSRSKSRSGSKEGRRLKGSRTRSRSGSKGRRRLKGLRTKSRSVSKGRRQSKRSRTKSRSRSKDRRRDKSHGKNRKSKDHNSERERKSSTRSHQKSRSRDKHSRDCHKRRSRSRDSHKRRSRSREVRKRSRSHSSNRRSDRQRHSRERRSRRCHTRSRSRSPSHSRSRDRSRRRSGSRGGNVSVLTLSTLGGGAITPQMALQQTMAAMSAKAQAMTGVALPTYYNPAAVNPLKYAEQVQKRKLLWQPKEKVEEQPKNTVWDKLTFAQDQDGKMTAKFRKLMGIKSEGNTTTKGEEEGEAPPEEDNAFQKQEVLFRDLVQQYEMARVTTHTQRGVGLGYSSQPFYPPMQK